ncbi:methyltransferase family protein [Actinomycetospora succinea]|uniref:Methyltransferase family protein n=1 Tax=Actinomycetospora succinea TaxID=663603 RepID=A0A4R6VJ45_9PSEU|nr:class I SAM-dependent methyltransferase [Actinomycetospora succinea]TDQ63297.1 methyltransferase family protein [Actinomycetospora succinea]
MDTESTDPYAHFAPGYGRHRRPDPRIAACVDEALGDARRVLNVGAGAGSYEPAGRVVLACDPSPAMLAQRPAGAAPAIRAEAEALPVADRVVDAALAVLTVHHWRDPAAGLAELVRVSRRQVVLTWDPDVMRRFWLVADYLPGIADAEAGLATLDVVVATLAGLGQQVAVRPVPVPADCTDGFLAAHWARPHAYLDPGVRAAASGLARLPEPVVDAAVARLADDLATGRWHWRYGAVAAGSSADLGYRLVVAR